MEFVLASKSPRRVEMLKSLGFDFTVRLADIDESSISLADPETGVEKIALEKAKACLHGLEIHEAVVLAADTIVVLDGEVLLKPKDAADARAMLSKLSGKTHTVFTGVAIMTERETRSFVESTDVTFFELTDEEIDDYSATGEPLDKAGAYGIQGRGSLLVKSINGDYFNVVGLPTAPVARLLKEFGVLPHKGV